MRKKLQDFINNLIHIYFLCTLLGSFLVYFVLPVAMPLLVVGANSFYVSFGVFLSGDVSQFWRICSLLWLVIFPVALIVSYILFVKKKKYCIIALIGSDVVVSLLYLIYTMRTLNDFAIPFAIADVVISLVVLLFLVIGFAKNNKEQSD